MTDRASLLRVPDFLRGRSGRRLAFGMLLLVLLLAVLWPKPPAKRGFLAMANPHNGSIIRTVAPHLGGLGELLLKRDCGSCHSQPARPPVPRLALPKNHPAVGSSIRDCAECHGAGQG